MAKILIMEDELGISLILTEVLTGNGHDVITVKDGKAGLQKLEADPLPDIVIMDNNLPFYNGRAILDKMNNNIKLQAIPKILMSGSSPNEEDFPDSRSYQAFISKPFDIFNFVDIVESCLVK
jgi:CheY-like chemotaxis protein